MSSKSHSEIATVAKHPLFHGNFTKIVFPTIIFGSNLPMDNEVEEALTNDRLINVSLDYKSMRDILTEMTSKIEQTIVQIKEIKSENSAHMIDSRLDKLQSDLKTLMDERAERLAHPPESLDVIQEHLEMSIEAVRSALSSQIKEVQASLSETTQRFTLQSISDAKIDLLSSMEKHFGTLEHISSLQQQIDGIHQKLSTKSSKKGEKESNKEKAARVEIKEKIQTQSADQSMALAQIKETILSLSSRVDPLENSQKRISDSIQTLFQTDESQASRFIQTDKLIANLSSRLDAKAADDTSKLTDFSKRLNEQSALIESMSKAIGALSSDTPSADAIPEQPQNPGTPPPPPTDFDKAKREIKASILMEVLPGVNEIKNSFNEMTNKLKKIDEQHARTEEKLDEYNERINRIAQTKSKEPEKANLTVGEAVEIRLDFIKPEEKPPEVTKADIGQIKNGVESIERKEVELENYVRLLENKINMQKESIPQHQQPIHERVETRIVETDPKGLSQQIGSLRDSVMLVNDQLLGMEKRILELEKRKPEEVVRMVKDTQTEIEKIEEAKPIVIEEPKPSTQIDEEKHPLIQMADILAQVHEEEQKQVEEIKTVEPPKHVESIKTVEVIKPTEPEKPIEPEKAVEPTKAIEPPKVEVIRVEEKTSSLTNLQIANLSQANAELQKKMGTMEDRMQKLLESNNDLSEQLENQKKLVSALQMVGGNGDASAALKQIQSLLDSKSSKMQQIERSIQSLATANSVQKVAASFDSNMTELNRRIDSIKGEIPHLVPRKELSQILQQIEFQNSNEPEATAAGRMTYKCLLCGRTSSNVAGMITDSEVARMLGAPPIIGVPKAKNDKFVLVYGKDGNAYRSSGGHKVLPNLVPPALKVEN